MGGNPAENHPCGFKWPIEAKLERNAKMIVVDPRFTRTAATADLFLQIRAGSDIAFLGGLINYAIENGRIARDYLAQLHQRRHSSCRKASSCPRTACFPASMPLPRPTIVRPGTTSRRGPAGAPSASDTRRSPKPEGSGHQAGGPAGAKTIAASRNGRARRHAAASALRVPAAQETVLALHAGNGRAHHRDPERSVPEGGRPLHLDPQRRRHEEGRDHHLRGRLDAAHLRHPDHPRRGDAAAADGQRRPRRRRRERAARPLEHPGRDRHGGHLRHPARLSEDGRARRRRSRDLSEAHDADARPSRRSGTRSTTGRTRRSSRSRC